MLNWGVMTELAGVHFQVLLWMRLDTPHALCIHREFKALEGVNAMSMSLTFTSQPKDSSIAKLKLNNRLYIDTNLLQLTLC